MSSSGRSDQEVVTIDPHPEPQAKVFRHNCKSKCLGLVNKHLSLEQKSIIQSTPFGWLVFVHEEIKLSRGLLSKLCSAWVERKQGFAIQCQFVSFSLLDVCLGVGLRVTSTRIDLRKTRIISRIRSCFEKGDVTVEMIYSEILKRDNDISSEDFYKLYILLGLSEFFLPTRMGLVHDGLFNIVDDLDKLGTYNWGGLVYGILVDSLCSASKRMTQENLSFIHLDGCVYLLQISAVEHLFSYKRHVPTSENKYPRIMHWMDVRVDDHELQRGLCKNMVVVELCASNEELCSEFVQEAFHQFGCGIRKKKPTKDEVRTKRVKVVELIRKCEEQKVLITRMEKEVKDILELIASRNYVLDDTRSEIVEVEPLSVDCTYFKKPESSHEDVHEEKDLHGDEDRPNQEVNMFLK